MESLLSFRLTKQGENMGCKGIELKSGSKVIVCGGSGELCESDRKQIEDFAEMLREKGRAKKEKEAER